MLDPILTYSWQMKDIFLDKEFLLLRFLALHNHLISVYLAVFFLFHFVQPYFFPQNRAFIREKVKVHELKNERNYMGFLIQKI